MTSDVLLQRFQLWKNTAICQPFSNLSAPRNWAGKRVPSVPLHIAVCSVTRCPVLSCIVSYKFFAVLAPQIGRGQLTKWTHCKWAVSKTLRTFLLTLKCLLSQLLSRLFRGLRFGFRELLSFQLSQSFRSDSFRWGFRFRWALAANDFAILSRPAFRLSRKQQS